jgi:hypothetical protein
MQRAIDNLCEYTFKNPAKARWARIYFYRTRLNMKPDKVAAIFELDQRLVNSIAMEIGRNKTKELQQIEEGLKHKFPDYHLARYKNHILNIANRINYSTLEAQEKRPHSR